MADAKVVIRGDSSGAVKATDDVKKGFEDVPKSSDKASRGINAVTGALAVAANAAADSRTADSNDDDAGRPYMDVSRRTAYLLLRAEYAVFGIIFRFVGGPVTFWLFL